MATEKKEERVGGTKRIKCDCANAYQDRRYGRGVRVHNRTAKKVGDRPIYRCTSCGKDS